MLMLTSETSDIQIYKVAKIYNFCGHISCELPSIRKIHSGKRIQQLYLQIQIQL